MNISIKMLEVIKDEKTFELLFKGCLADMFDVVSESRGDFSRFGMVAYSSNHSYNAQHINKGCQSEYLACGITAMLYINHLMYEHGKARHNIDLIYSDRFIGITMEAMQYDRDRHDKLFSSMQEFAIG